MTRKGLDCRNRAVSGRRSGTQGSKQFLPLYFKHLKGVRTSSKNDEGRKEKVAPICGRPSQIKASERGKLNYV